MVHATTPADVPIAIGIDTEHRRAVAEGLGRLLADSYTLYLKTHNFHWNVTGPMFNTLHLLFEQQYTELALAVDLVAERIRALGRPAPGSYAEFSRLTSIKEAAGVPHAPDMIRELLEGQETVARTARAGVPGRRARRRPGHRGPADAAACRSMRRTPGCSGVFWNRRIGLDRADAARAACPLRPTSSRASTTSVTHT